MIEISQSTVNTILLAKYFEFSGTSQPSYGRDFVVDAFQAWLKPQQVNLAIDQNVEDGFIMQNDFGNIEAFSISKLGKEEIKRYYELAKSDVRFILETTFDFPLFFHLVENNEPRFDGQIVPNNPASAMTKETAGDNDSPKGSRASRPIQIALTYAGEQRAYVDAVAESLRMRRVSLFYDRFSQKELWGKDGTDHFHDVFASKAQFVVMFISKEYLEKAWTRHERKSALSEQMKRDEEYILPVRFDDSKIEGLPDSIQYLSSADFTPAGLAVAIARKIGAPPNGIGNV